MDIVNYVDTVFGRVIETVPFDIAAARSHEGTMDPGVVGIVADRVLGDAEAVALAMHLLSLPVE